MQEREQAREAVQAQAQEQARELGCLRGQAQEQVQARAVRKRPALRPGSAEQPAGRRRRKHPKRRMALNCRRLLRQKAQMRQDPGKTLEPAHPPIEAGWWESDGEMPAGPETAKTEETEAEVAVGTKTASIGSLLFERIPWWFWLVAFAAVAASIVAFAVILETSGDK